MPAERRTAGVVGGGSNASDIPLCGRGICKIVKPWRRRAGGGEALKVVREEKRCAVLDVCSRICSDINNGRLAFAAILAF